MLPERLNLPGFTLAAVTYYQRLALERKKREKKREKEKKDDRWEEWWLLFNEWSSAVNVNDCDINGSEGLEVNAKGQPKSNFMAESAHISPASTTVVPGPPPPPPPSLPSFGASLPPRCHQLTSLSQRQLELTTTELQPLRGTDGSRERLYLPEMSMFPSLGSSTPQSGVWACERVSECVSVCVYVAEDRRAPLPATEWRRQQLSGRINEPPWRQQRGARRGLPKKTTENRGLTPTCFTSA